MLVVFLLASVCAQVEINLSTQWKGPSQRSLIQEMSEYFSQIGLFWHFIEKLDECTRDAIDIEHIADDAARSSIEKELILFSLYNREFSARLEFYSNLEKDDRSRLKEKCGNFYVINSDVSCTLDSTLFNSPARPRFDFDHILFENNENSLIAYVDIADPEFSKFNKQLEKFCNENKAALILRHRDLRADTKDYLGGYGAELLVKNMEYKPIEDANSIQNSNEKDWNIEDLPFKALESVLNILPDWNKMTHILETLPLHLSEFSAVEYSSKTKEEAMMSAFQNSQLVGENIFLVNGHYLQPDFWTLLGTLRAEIDALENLKLLGIPHDAALSILEKSNLNLHAYKGEGGAFLKTGPSTGRIYINDLENDTKYARWTKNYQVFLMSYGRDLEQVARHFFNLILVADLREESGWHAIELVRQMYEFDWPVRLGLILLGNDPIANILTQAIKSLKNKEDELNSFLKDIDINLSYNQILKLFNQYCFDCDFDEEIGHTVTRSNNFCEESGICGPVKFILNGRVLDINVDVNDLEEFQNNLTVEIMKEKRQIMMFAMYGSLQPPLDTFFENVKYAKPVERINLEITQPSSDQIEVDDRSHDGFLVELNDLAKLVSFTVIANDDSDKKLVSDSFEMLRRFSHLALRVRYILNLNSIDEDWDKIMCFIMAINDRKKGNFDEFVCDYNTNDYRRLIIKPNTDLKSGVIVNGRYLKRHFIKSFRDLMIAHDVETQRLRVNEIFEELTKHISSNEISNIIEKSTQVILKHVKHLPYFAQYSSDPIPQTIRRKSVSRVIQSDSIRYFNVDLLLNPLSEKGQVLASLGKWLLELGTSIKVTLNPDLDAKKKILPINRFQKILIKHDFSDTLKLGEKSSQTFTLGLNVPESWVVRSLSKDDLDNLLLKDSISVSYTLRNLLANGQCVQYIHGFETEPPNGLQLALSNSSDIIADTIVMKNLGYFQFKANPGLYKLSLFPGRSSELFDLTNNEEHVIVKDLSAEIQRLRVSKKQEFEDEVLLNAISTDDKGDTIHIFSLASGKLYERLLKIMILSVMKHTNSKVKFWLIEDFFTTYFKVSLEPLSKEIGFQYEFVSYKWPNWMFAQKEKQRIIWAYKILFLDVLFPLDIQRIIYIDADQVVRSDIKELWDIDLDGAPYGYTPFCDSNPTTEGFRFWKQGYWKDHLRGLPYHISALYVIDLSRFRSMGAGDILRYFYETMAPNPDSLSNLDQDLPNYAQFQVPIFSLPQEWLWCGTWCSEESKAKAKTIDLCNNPLTKEPKIVAAKRIIPEWEEYDNFLKNFESGKETNSNIKIDL